MELFAKMVNERKVLTTFAKIAVLQMLDWVLYTPLNVKYN